MPVAIPIAMAAYSTYTAITVATLWTGLAAAGSIIGAMGAISGDQDMMKIGSIIGVVGGVGSLGAGLAGSSPTLADGTAIDASVAIDNAAANATANGSLTDVMSYGQFGAEQTLADVATNAGGNLAGGTLAGQQGILESQGVNLPEQTTPDSYTWDGAQGAEKTVAEEAGATNSSAYESPSASNSGDKWDWGSQTDAKFSNGSIGPQMPDAATDKYGSLKDLFGDAEKWMKENPNSAKLGGGLLKGAMDYVGQRQQIKDRMNAQKGYQEWLTQKYSDSVRNLTIPSIIRQPAQPGGIIAGQRG